jgi:hypothetical protein
MLKAGNMAEDSIILIELLEKNERFYSVFCTLFNGRILTVMIY